MNENPYANSSDEQTSPPPIRRKSLILKIVGWTISLGIIFVVGVMMLVEARRDTRNVARRVQCKNNLRQIGLALHYYHEQWGALPPAYTVDADGKPLHSWRTLILPYLDEKALYETIDLTKPWDDPVNELPRKTPLAIYRCPSVDISSPHTTYVAIVGEEFAFAPTRPRPFSEIKDGLSNTIFVMEVSPDETFEWMKPQDGGEQIILKITPESRTTHTGGLQVTMGDGAARFISHSVPQETRRALITVDAGDAIGEF